jgi:hypothetical protein
MPSINWSDLSLQDSRCGCFNHFVISNGFTQLVCNPTRGDNILDIILNNDNLATFDLAYHPPFSTSDHLSLAWKNWYPINNGSSAPDNVQNSLFNFAKADYEMLHDYLSAVDWPHEFMACHPSDIESLWSIFKRILFNAISVCVPVTTSSQRSSKLSYPKHIRVALNKKKTLWRKRFSALGKSAYKAFALKCDKLIRRHHAGIERRIIRSNSVSSFYNYVGRKLNAPHKVAPLRADNGSYLVSDTDKAEALNTYFASVFTPHAADCATSDLPWCNAPVSQSVDFSIATVLNALRNTKHTLSSGPDGIPSVFWSKLSSVVAFPTSIIFSSSYNSSQLPKDWKHAIVIPAYKKSDASLAKNYRPISLTNTLSKVMESIVKDNMLAHLNDNSLLDINQHGFLPSHSTSTQVLESCYDWCKANDEGFLVDAIYLDFSKAFDVISHSKLIHKLKSFNFCSLTVNWLSAFLTDRTQAVRCNSSLSSSVRVTSGTPQGSVCGPILFVLFINDLASVCAPCSIKLYADDVKLYFTIKQASDRQILQDCVSRVFNWAAKWDLKFSYDKCQLLQIGYSDPNISYYLGDYIIKPVDSICDLGVNVHSSLKPSLHCSIIAAKANSRAKLIIKCFLSRNPSNYIRAYKTYVRPLLEYASVVWNPSLLKDINLIENVQRSFTRKVCFLCNLPAVSYDQRLLMFNLDSLEMRRLKCDLVELFKIVHKYSACSIYETLNFCHNNAYNVTRGHRLKIAVVRTRKYSFKHFFINRVLNVWNFLPDSCFHSNLISVFKNKLCNIDLSRFMRAQL